MTAASFVVVAQVLVHASAGARQRTATVKTTAAVHKELWEILSRVHVSFLEHGHHGVQQ